MEDASDIGELKNTVDRLIEMRGVGGPQTKTRQFANGCERLLSTSMRLLTANIREIREQDQNE